jgi:hypothetical protein
MTTKDITPMLAGLRGDDFVNALRGIHADLKQRGGRLRCSGSDCTDAPTLIGIHACGAPGVPICEKHNRQQQEWMAMAAVQGKPYCRHCGQDVDSSHVYAVGLE